MKALKNALSLQKFAIALLKIANGTSSNVCPNISVLSSSNVNAQKSLLMLKLKNSFLFHPEKFKTNQNISLNIGVPIETIFKKTGVIQRPIIQDLKTTEACIQLLKEKDLPKKIDLCIFTTSTPDQFIPSSSSLVMSGLGISSKICFDLNAACTGYIQALSTVFSIMHTKSQFSRAMIISADRGIKLAERQSGKEELIFSDGIVATFFEKNNTKGWSLVAEDHQSFPEDKNLIKVEEGAFSCPQVKASISLNGPLVFSRAVKAMKKSIENVLDQARLNITDIDYIIPHQGNFNITKRLMKDLNLETDKVYNGISNWGNSISATVPTGIHLSQQKLKKSRYILLTSFGAGTSVASVLIKNHF